MAWVWVTGYSVLFVIASSVPVVVSSHELCSFMDRNGTDRECLQSILTIKHGGKRTAKIVDCVAHNIVKT